jgi:hypothetical protein
MTSYSLLQRTEVLTFGGLHYCQSMRGARKANSLSLRERRIDWQQINHYPQTRLILIRGHLKSSAALLLPTLLNHHPQSWPPPNRTNRLETRRLRRRPPKMILRGQVAYPFPSLKTALEQSVANLLYLPPASSLCPDKEVTPLRESARRPEGRTVPDS